MLEHEIFMKEHLPVTLITRHVLYWWKWRKFLNLNKELLILLMRWYLLRKKWTTYYSTRSRCRKFSIKFVLLNLCNVCLHCIIARLEIHIILMPELFKKLITPGFKNWLDLRKKDLLLILLLVKIECKNLI